MKTGWRPCGHRRLMMKLSHQSSFSGEFSPSERGRLLPGVDREDLALAARLVADGERDRAAPAEDSQLDRALRAGDQARPAERPCRPKSSRATPGWPRRFDASPQSRGSEARVRAAASGNPAGKGGERGGRDVPLPAGRSPTTSTRRRRCGRGLRTPPTPNGQDRVRCAPPDPPRPTVSPAAPPPPRRYAGLEIREAADGFVVYDPRRDRLHFLNGTALFILECLDGTTGIQELPLVAAALPVRTAGRGSHRLPGALRGRGPDRSGPRSR